MPSPEIVMFLVLDGDENAESREVTAVPDQAEVISVDGKRYEIDHRAWQWDSSGRVRVVVYAYQSPPAPTHVGSEATDGYGISLTCWACGVQHISPNPADVYCSRCGSYIGGEAGDVQATLLEQAAEAVHGALGNLRRMNVGNATEWLEKAEAVLERLGSPDA